jgi:hypothetical protein
LGVEGGVAKLVATQEGAAVFTLRSSTPTDRVRVTEAVHRIRGGGSAAKGLTAHVSAERGVQALRGRLDAEIRAYLWPDGVPADLDEMAVQEDVDKTFRGWTTELADAFRALRAMQERWELFGTWEVLVTAPAELRELCEADLPEPVVIAIEAAIARAGEELDEGNGDAFGS